jgi:putative redox protein
MKLNVHLEEQPFVLNLTNSDGLVTVIDASPEIGGKNKGLRPMQLLAGSLASCMSIDILLILKKQRIEVGKYEVEIDAKRAAGVPSPFESIELTFSVDKGVPLEKLENAVKLSHEKYCSVSASINPAILVTTHTKHVE